MPTKSTIDPFKVSAAALVASYRVSDIVWRKHFPKLPRERPELRTILSKLHHSAVADNALNMSEAERMIMDEFGVTDRTARRWLRKIGSELGLVVRLPADREIHLVPSESTKALLHKVGLEYLACARLAFQALSDAVKLVDISYVDWTDEIGELSRSKVSDYTTTRGKEPKTRSPEMPAGT